MGKAHSPDRLPASLPHPLLLLLLLSAALALATSSARAAEAFPAPEGQEEAAACSPDDDEPGVCGPGEPTAAGPLAPPDAGVDAGPLGPEASIGATRVKLRPARARPGDLVEISVVGEHLRSAAASFAGRPISLFASGPSAFAGYASAPLDFPSGPALVHVAVVDEEMVVRSGSALLQIDDREVARKTITVASRFTSPSAAQVAQMKADGRAIAASYRIPFGPPLFRGNFSDPLGGERGSRFGERRVFNGKTRSRHWGVDIDGDRGEPVRAANDGVVTLARPCFTSGLTVLVSHGAGLFTGYFHFSKFAVKAGQAVKRGEVLGFVGSTGRSTGPHLHFAAKLGEMSIDPEALLTFDFSRGLPDPPRADAGLATDASAAGPTDTGAQDLPDGGTGSRDAAREPSPGASAQDAGPRDAAGRDDSGQ